MSDCELIFSSQVEEEVVKYFDYNLLKLLSTK